MSTANTQSLNFNSLEQGKDKQIQLKNLITNDIIRLTDSIEPIQNTTADILQELTKSIGQIDFMLLAFPESTEITKQFYVLNKKFR